MHFSNGYELSLLHSNYFYLISYTAEDKFGKEELTLGCFYDKAKAKQYYDLLKNQPSLVAKALRRAK